jgi:hypothetical protein
MIVQLANTTARVGWRHTFPGDPHKSPGTVCVVETETATSVGFAKLRKGETFIKEIGRKVSLTRAIRLMSKNDRSAIWEAYLGRKL